MYKNVSFNPPQTLPSSVSVNELFGISQLQETKEKLYSLAFNHFLFVAQRSLDGNIYCIFKNHENDVWLYTDHVIIENSKLCILAYYPLSKNAIRAWFSSSSSV